MRTKSYRKSPFPCGTASCDARPLRGFAYCSEHAGSERDAYARLNEAIGRGDWLYLELGKIDTRDGSEQATFVQSLRERYEWMCMGEERSPSPLGTPEELYSADREEAQ